MIRLDKITKIYDAKVENKKALDEVSCKHRGERRRVCSYYGTIREW